MRDLDAVGITEPFEVPEFRVSGIARIEQVEDGVFEVTFFKRKPSEKIINVTLTMQMGSIPPLLVALAQAIGCEMVATCPKVRAHH